MSIINHGIDKNINDLDDSDDSDNSYDVKKQKIEDKKDKQVKQYKKDEEEKRGKHDMDYFMKIVKKFEINQYSKINSILPSLLHQNHSYEDFIIIMRLCANKMNKKDQPYGYYDSLNELLKEYCNKYYTNYSMDNVVKLCEFMRLYKEGMNYDSDIYLKSNVIIDTFLDKLTLYDIEYLIKHKIIYYYYGKRKISKEIFNLFYEYRHELIHSSTNAFVMKGYTTEQLDDLITISLNTGVSFQYIWNYISDRVLTLEIPYWFWDKHKTSICWHFAIENIINLMDETDTCQLNIFLKWMQDFYVFIDNSLKSINKYVCFPEIMIATFYISPNLNLTNILKYQKLSIKLLNFLAEHDVLIRMDWENISMYQILDPDFMKKYDSLLDWKMLSFNPTWKYFPHNKFHRHLETSIQNVLLWGTLENKLKVFKTMGLDLNQCIYNTKKPKTNTSKHLDNDNTLVHLYIHYNESRYGTEKGKSGYSHTYNNNLHKYNLTYHDTTNFHQRYGYSNATDFSPLRNLQTTKYISQNNANKIVNTYREVSYYRTHGTYDINVNDNLDGPPVFSCFINVNASMYLNENNDVSARNIAGTKTKKIIVNINDILCYHAPLRLKNSNKKGDDIFIPTHENYQIKTDIDGSILTIADAPWPGFTPDLLSIVLVVATQAGGDVLIHQKMFESRLFFVDKLIDMGAKIMLCDPHRAVVMGHDFKSQLKATTMSSPDIRAGISLLIAALSAKGTSTIQNIEQIDRGYERIDERLRAIGANIVRV
jgi:hypothetical protein